LPVERHSSFGEIGHLVEHGGGEVVGMLVDVKPYL
jgi:hypothetical protein